MYCERKVFTMKKFEVEKGKVIYIFDEVGFVNWTKCALSDMERKALIREQRKKEKEQIKIRDFKVSVVSS